MPDNPPVCLCNIYGPNADKPIFYETLEQSLLNYNEHKLLMGDFNLVLDPKLDKYRSPLNSNPKAADQLKAMMNEQQMVDVWRIRNEHTMRFSWKRKNPRLQASRIDMAIATRGLDHFITNIFYFNGIHSDHDALFLNLEITDNDRGPGFWKFNASNLRSMEFLNQFKESLRRDIAATNELLPIQRWCTVKERIQKTLKKLSRSKANEESLIIGELTEKLTLMNDNLPLNRHDQDIYDRTELDLEALSMRCAEKLIFRSKVCWYELGERTTKYFYNMEKARFNAKTCNMLLMENGDIIKDQHSILQQQRKFYQQLYMRDDTIHFNLVNTTDIKITDQQHSDFQQEFTLHELSNAVRRMRNDKAPGPDGIPIEVYKVCWPEIGQIMLEACLESYQQGELYHQAKKGILNLIPKAKKDTRILANLRPITLLNTDYKLIEKMIAGRMESALPGIINHDQKGFMANRRISANIRKLYDLITITKRDQIPAFIMSLDFKKCFDFISFDIIRGSLQYFNFPDFMIRWIDLLYTDFTVKVQNNGYLSDDISIERSVHQGGCCSGHIFLCCAELMAIEIRKSPTIQGINVDQLIYLLNQFADDTDITSEFSQQSMDGICNSLHNFRNQSGFTISYDKTSILRIGSLEKSDASLYTQSPIAWTNDSINVLGVDVYTNVDDVTKNYETTIAKAANVLKRWENKSLSLVGKVNVINTLISSLFVYKLTVLPAPTDQQVRVLHGMISDFLWDNKRPKIPLKVLMLNKSSGGLGLTDIKKRKDAINITWMQILQNDEKTANLFYNICKIPLKENTWRCNLHPKDVKFIVCPHMSPFWYGVMSSWVRYNFKPAEDLTNTFLWMNSHIRVRNRPYFCHRYYERGLQWISQLFRDELLKSQREMEAEFGMSVMDYNMLVSALPNGWKSANKVQENSTEYDVTVLHPNLARIMYAHFTTDMTGLHSKINKWSQVLGNITADEFYLQFNILQKSTNVPKYRSFQYRLLHRALIFNEHLYAWGYIDDDSCLLCETEKESMEHAMFSCPSLVDY